MSLHVRTPPALTNWEKRFTFSSVLTISPATVVSAVTAAASACKLLASLNTHEQGLLVSVLNKLKNKLQA